jgi:hypothetical protein
MVVEVSEPRRCRPTWRAGDVRPMLEKGSRQVRGHEVDLSMTTRPWKKVDPANNNKRLSGIKSDLPLTCINRPSILCFSDASDLVSSVGLGWATTTISQTFSPPRFPRRPRHVTRTVWRE